LKFVVAERKKAAARQMGSGFEKCKEGAVHCGQRS
jgi:hypothetical protein